MSDIPASDFAPLENSEVVTPDTWAEDYNLPADFGIYAAAQTQQELQTALKLWIQDSDRRIVNLTGSAVESLDASGIQILIALQRSLAERGLQLHLNHPSTALHQGLQRMGTSSLLACCH